MKSMQAQAALDSRQTIQAAAAAAVASKKTKDWKRPLNEFVMDNYVCSVNNNNKYAECRASDYEILWKADDKPRV